MQSEPTDAAFVVVDGRSLKVTNRLVHVRHTKLPNGSKLFRLNPSESLRALERRIADTLDHTAPVWQHREVQALSLTARDRQSTRPPAPSSCTRRSAAVSAAAAADAKNQRAYNYKRALSPDEQRPEGPMWEGPPRPTQSMIDAMPTLAPLPDPDIEDMFMPWSGVACGGNIHFGTTIAAHPHARSDDGSGLYPTISHAMAEGAGIIFNSQIAHGTCHHHPAAERHPGDRSQISIARYQSPAGLALPAAMFSRWRSSVRTGSKAHWSVAVQTPACAMNPTYAKYTLGETVREYELCLQTMAEDARANYGDALWPPAWNVKDAKGPVDARGRPYDTLYDAGHVWTVQHKRVVVYNAALDPMHAKGGDIVWIYDFNMGFNVMELKMMRRELNFLYKWQFVLHRTMGALWRSEAGQQYMVMTGVQHRGRNINLNPETTRRSHEIASSNGDHDAYVRHFDYEKFSPLLFHYFFNIIAGCFRRAAPRTSGYIAATLKGSNFAERIRSKLGRLCTSDDLTVNNVGISSAYQSEQHADFSDGTVALALACKCPRDWTIECALARAPGTPRDHTYSYCRPCE